MSNMSNAEVHILKKLAKLSFPMSLAGASRLKGRHEIMWR